MTAAWTQLTDDTEWPGVDLAILAGDVGAQCWGCGHRLRRRGTEPTTWIEVLCGRRGCPTDEITRETR